MKTTYMMAFVAMASVLAIGVITVNGSVFPLVTASVTSESNTMLGHVEYTVYDSTGAITAYHQLDNLVVNTGEDCTAEALFGGSDLCDSAAGTFTFIGIGNVTLTIAEGYTTLGDGGSGTEVAIADGGIMAVRLDTDAASTASSANGNAGAITVIETELPFTFKLSGSNDNATTVRTAGLFDATCSVNSDTTGQCTTNGGTMHMFAAQAITVAVGEGDSLDVTWTITTGG